MISIEGTQEMVDRWQEHLAYVKSLGNRNSDWIHVAPDKIKKVLELYGTCGSKRKVAKDLHLAPKTVGIILDNAGVPT
jgi:hypothetical protein